MPINTITMGNVYIDITAETGADFTCWLEGSDDDSTFYEIPADQVLKTSGVAAPNTVQTDDRDICDGETATGKHAAVYRHLAAKYVRLKWILTGTNITFAAVLIGK